MFVFGFILPITIVCLQLDNNRYLIRFKKIDIIFN